MRRFVGGVAVVAFALVNLANALHKGGDFDVFLEAGERLLTRAHCTKGSSSGFGVIAPPAHAAALRPIRARRPGECTGRSRGVVLLNLAALFGGAWWWLRAIVAGPATAPPDRAHRTYWLSLLAIALPAQTNFEHQNMNALLLGLTGAAAWSLVRGQDIKAGLLVGTASAIKAFPALLVLYLVWRGNWRAVLSACAVAVSLTLVPGLWLETSPAWKPLTDWLVLAADPNWPDRPQNQSLIATTTRLFPLATIPLAAAIATALIVTIGWIAPRRRAPPSESLGAELAVVLLVAAILSPIAWDHYWVLALPAFQALRTIATSVGWATVAFWIAALLLTGPAPLLVGAPGLALARSWSTYTWAGLLLFLAVSVALASRGRTARSADPLTEP